MIFWARATISDVVAGAAGPGAMDGVADLDEVAALVPFVSVSLVPRREAERAEKERRLDFLRSLVSPSVVEAALLELLGLKMELSLSLAMLGDFKCGSLSIEAKLNYTMTTYVLRKIWGYRTEFRQLNRPIRGDPLVESNRCDFCSGVEIR